MRAILILLELTGLIALTCLVVLGGYYLFRNVWIRETTDRYRFKERQLENGTTITEVIDLENDEISREEQPAKFR